MERLIEIILTHLGYNSLTFGICAAIVIIYIVLYNLQLRK